MRNYKCNLKVIQMWKRWKIELRVGKRKTDSVQSQKQTNDKFKEGKKLNQSYCAHMLNIMYDVLWDFTYFKHMAL